LNWASWVAKSVSRGNDGIDHRGSGKRREGETFLTALSTNKEARLCDLRVGSFCRCGHLIPLLVRPTLKP
jgi:hypothetical protein